MERVVQENREVVSKYYDTAQIYYHFLWYRRKGLGLHYGLWTSDVKNRTEAIVNENEVMARIADVREGDVVLDAGCGVAGSGIWLSSNLNAKVVNINISQKQLEKGKLLSSRSNLTDELMFTKSDYHYLPFRDNTFDVFWSLESIEHSVNTPMLIAESHRVLKKGGRLVIAGTMRGRNKLTEEEERQLNVGLSVSGAFTDSRTSDQIADILKDTGFGNVRNNNFTDKVMKSAEEMTKMCRWGLPVAKVLSSLHLTSPLITKNNQWGLYQEGLFRSGATTYNILSATK